MHPTLTVVLSDDWDPADSILSHPEYLTMQAQAVVGVDFVVENGELFLMYATTDSLFRLFFLPLFRASCAVYARSTAPDCLSSNSEEVFMYAPHYTRDFQVLPLKSAILHPVSTTLLRRRAIQSSLSVFFHELRPSKVDLPQSDAVVPTSCHDIIYWGDLAFK